MEPHSKRLRIDLTPSEISQEIPQSLLPIACGPLSAKAYRDNHARPLVWLLFGGTGALGKQISRTAIARRDRVFIAALDEADTDCDFPLDKQGPILSNPEKNSSSKSSQSKDSGIENDENIGIDVAGSGKGESNNKEVSSQQTPVQQNNKLGDFPMLNSSNASVTFDPTTKSKQSRGKKRVKIIDPESTASALDIGYLHIDEKFKHLCYRVKCDVRIKESVDRAVQKCLQVFGRIDVVVNCFGYGLMGACEEQLDTEIRSQFETNLMGLFHTTRAVLPYLTNAARMSANDKVPNESIKKSAYRNNVNSNAPITSTPGHIISFTSSMALLGTPGFGPYSATRWAAEGLLESLSFEVEHLGCKVTIIETGYAKSGNKDDDRARVAKTTGTHGLNSTPISSHFFLRDLSPQYQNTPAEYGVQFVKHLDKILATSTVKVASIIWEIGHCQNPPLRLLLGSVGVLGMKDKLRGMAEEIEDWKYLYEENQ